MSRCIRRTRCRYRRTVSSSKEKHNESKRQRAQCDHCGCQGRQISEVKKSDIGDTKYSQKCAPPYHSGEREVTPAEERGKSEQSF